MRDLVRLRGGVAAATALVVLAALGGLTACDADEPVAAGLTCADAIHAAALATDTDEQVRGLDAALLRCPTYERYVLELAKYPGAIGYSPERYVQVRCAALTETRLRHSPACLTASPPTTAAPASDDEPVYAAATLDGRVIELRPSDGVQFIGDVPAVVQQTVDIATQSGCDAVLAQRDEWLARVTGDDAASDAASVYAQHAINVALWIGCDGAQPAPPTSAPAPSTSAATG